MRISPPHVAPGEPDPGLSCQDQPSLAKYFFAGRARLVYWWSGHSTKDFEVALPAWMLERGQAVKLPACNVNAYIWAEDCSSFVLQPQHHNSGHRNRRHSGTFP